VRSIYFAIFLVSILFSTSAFSQTAPWDPKKPAPLPNPTSPTNPKNQNGKMPEVVVKLPGANGALGKFILRGQPHSSQSSSYSIYKCDVDILKGKVRLKNLGCKSFSAGKLDQEIGLPEGHYFLKYNSMMMYPPFEIKKGTSKEVTLKKLSIPLINGKYRVSVIRDYSNPIEQEKFLFEYWAITHTKCPPTNKSFYCRYHISNDWKTLKAYYLFNSDGSYTYPSYSDRFTTIESINDGEWIAVLPGVYGLRVRDEFGINSSQLGIIISK
jgi:hypothetical protein